LTRLILAFLCAATPSLANGDGPALSGLYDILSDGDAVCFAAKAAPEGDAHTVKGLLLTLTKSVESPNGTAPGKGFVFTLDLGLTGTPDSQRIYGCCDQTGYCGTGETCSDQPVFLRKSGGNDGYDALDVDLSAYPKRGPTTVPLPDAERPTIGAQDSQFSLPRASCEDLSKSLTDF